MALIGAEALRKLNNKDFRVLSAIEVGMRYGEYVDLDNISKVAKISAKNVDRSLKKCHDLKLIHRWTGHYIGYELTIHGYDTLALNALYEKGIIEGIGREKGVGKESRVYYAITKAQDEVILKLHRVGFTSFQHVKKKRSYTSNKHHISELYSSRLSAETEKKWLDIANKSKLPVPKIIGYNRHIIVQELIDGIDLFKVRDLSDPIGVLEDILNFIRDAWHIGKFVHGDLSEHNIIINNQEKPIVIDFPQAVHQNESNSIEYLTRDIDNIATFFTRKFKLDIDSKSLFDQITQIDD